MNDQEFLKSLEQVSDPREALRVLVENEHFLGYDQYCGDLRRGLLKMCERCAKQDPTTPQDPALT